MLRVEETFFEVSIYSWLPGVSQAIPGVRKEKPSTYGTSILNFWGQYYAENTQNPPRLLNQKIPTKVWDLAVMIDKSSKI